MHDKSDDANEEKSARPFDPVQRVREQAKQALPKRFYERVTVAAVDGAYGVHLDGRPLRTPGRAIVLLPTEGAAQRVADEFAAQDATINPVSMPTTRLVNTAIDGVAAHADAVLEDILRFAAGDLVCYRADGPERLVEKESVAWDPIIDWARNGLGARFILAEGVMHVEQPREAVAAIAIHMRARCEPLRLAAIHVMTSLTGSALLALAVEAGEIDGEAAWGAAHVDEDWNIEQWGEDAEAATRRAMRRRDMMAAVGLLDALNG